MSTEIFKVGDPVYIPELGWCKITKLFNKTASLINFNGDTCISNLNLLSFTEYDLINGGWSQDRSVLNQPKRGDLVYVRNNEREPWQMRRFAMKSSTGNSIACFPNQDGTGELSSCKEWLEWSIENPLLKEEE